MSILAALGVMGCVSLNPVTMVRLATLNPMEADPGVIAVELVLPDGIDVVDGSAAMTISATFAETEEEVSRFALARSGDVWRIASADQEALRDLQARVRAQRQADPDAVSGSLSVGFEPCVQAPGPAEDARVSINIQLDADGGFLPLINGARISEMFSDDEIASPEPC